MIIYKITFSVPCNEWEKIKAQILSIDFKTDKPTLTRHQPHHEREFATFTANHYNDILTVAKLLPPTATTH